MATVREYAYYIKGNRICVVEKDTAFDNDANSRDYGPGSDRAQWKSPLSSVTNGIEIEYTYSPLYSISASSLSEQVNKFWFNGWTVIGGNVTFVRSSLATLPNFTSAPYSAIADGEYILIRNSNRWNGLHKVKSASANGYVQTYTEANQSVKFVSGSSNIVVGAEGAVVTSQSQIHASDGSNIWLASVYDAGDYIWMYDNTTAHNRGFWKIESTSTTASGTDEQTSAIYIKDRYYFPDQLTSTVTDLAEEQIDTTIDTTADGAASVKIYQAFHDPCYAISDVDTINDENDEIPLMPYLERALVDYVKAQLAEDMRDMEASAYYMKKFRKRIEIAETNKMRGYRAIVTGPHAIR